MYMYMCTCYIHDGVHTYNIWCTCMCNIIHVLYTGTCTCAHVTYTMVFIPTIYGAHACVILYM